MRSDLNRALLCVTLAVCAAVPASLSAFDGAARATPLSVKLDGADYYHYFGEKIPLDRLGDRVAVRFEGTRTSLASARSLAAEVAVSTTGARALSSGVVVLELARGQEVAAVRRSLAASSQVAWVAPVYRPQRAGNLWVATDEILVRVKDSERTVRPRFAKDPRVLSYKRLVSTADTYVLTVTAGEAALALANEFAESGVYEWAAPNAVQSWKRFATTDDPLLSRQWHLQNLGGSLNGNPGQNSLAGADAKVRQAWDINPGGSPSIVVAVIDDGPEKAHPDLAPNLYVNPGEIAGNGIDDDGNGYVDDVSGWDFSAGVPGDNDGGPSLDSDEHGTSVAGVIAARGNNGIGVAGAAYNVRWFPSRIFAGATATDDAGVAAAVNFASGRSADGLSTGASAADITNNSWGGGSPAAVITDAFAWGATHGRGGKGIVHCIAAGNGGTDGPSYPGTLASTLPNVVCVGASTDLDQRAYYSQYGVGLDLVAPSNGGTYSIVTTDRSGALGYDPGPYAGEASASTGFGGTSSATPLTSGVAALMLSQQPSLTAIQLRTLLRASADRIDAGSADYSGTYPAAGSVAASIGWDHHLGFGRLNAYAALRGLSNPELAVYHGGPELSTAERLNLSTDSGVPLTDTLQIRNQSLLDISVYNVSITPGPVTLVSSTIQGDSIGPGETAVLTLQLLSPTSGSGSQTLTFLTGDADESSYTFTVNWTVLPVSLRGRVVVDYDGDGLADDTEPGLSGRKVFLDTNGNLILDTTGFIPSSDVPKSVPDGVAAGINSTLGVANSGVVGSIRVAVNLTHTWLSDMTISLTSPSGTTVVLFAGSGSSSDNLTGTIFDDDATLTLGGGTGPFAGSYRPANPLSVFLGEPVTGTWTLHLVDSIAPDPGTLTSWSLELGTERSARTDANGDYRFSHVSPGSYNIVADVPLHWARSPLAIPFHAVTLVGSEELGPFGFAQGVIGSLYGRVWHDSDLSGTAQAHEGGVPDVTVFVDSNLSGNPDGTAPATYPATDLPIAIPDKTTVLSSVTLPAGNVSGLTVTIGSLIHTWDGDLTLELVHPDGTVVLLANQRGSSGDNYTQTVFDDLAASAITAGSPPYTGRFRPEGSLASLSGKSMAGTWQLRVTDGFDADTGTLVAWSISVTGGEAQTTTDANGYYAFHGLPVGTTNLVAVPPLRWSTFAPLTGKQSFVLTSFDTFPGKNFGFLNAIRSTDLSIRSIDFSRSNAILQGLALPVQAHRVQGRASLSTGTWTDRGTFTPNLDGTFQWEDPAATPSGNFFYRIVTP